MKQCKQSFWTWLDEYKSNANHDQTVGQREEYKNDIVPNLIAKAQWKSSISLSNWALWAKLDESKNDIR